MKKITITFKGSKSNIQVEGASGSECTKLTEGLESALGKVNRRELTMDYYQQFTLNQQQLETGFDR